MKHTDKDYSQIYGLAKVFGALPDKDREGFVYFEVEGKKIFFDLTASGDDLRSVAVNMITQLRLALASYMI